MGRNRGFGLWALIEVPSWVPSCILAFIQHFGCSAFYLPTLVLGAGDALVTRTQMLPALKELVPSF